MRSIICTVIFSAAICALLFIYAGCPGLFRAVGNVAAECGPGLIAEVSDTLTQDDWQAKLKERGLKVGIDAVACAVQAVLKSLSDPGAASMIRLQTPSRVGNAAMVKDRAALWLKVYRTERR